jgi:hypothetical protein
MKDQSSVPVAQKMTDVSLLIFPVEVQKRRIQMIDNTFTVNSPQQALMCGISAESGRDPRMEKIV